MKSALDVRHLFNILTLPFALETNDFATKGTQHGVHRGVYKKARFSNLPQMGMLIFYMCPPNSTVSAHMDVYICLCDGHNVLCACVMGTL